MNLFQYKIKGPSLYPNNFNYLPGSVRQYDENFCEIDDTDNIIIDSVK